MYVVFCNIFFFFQYFVFSSSTCGTAEELGLKRLSFSLHLRLQCLFLVNTRVRICIEILGAWFSTESRLVLPFLCPVYSPLHVFYWFSLIDIHIELFSSSVFLVCNSRTGETFNWHMWLGSELYFLLRHRMSVSLKSLGKNLYANSRKQMCLEIKSISSSFFRLLCFLFSSFPSQIA